MLSRLPTKFWFWSLEIKQKFNFFQGFRNKHDERVKIFAVQLALY